MTPDTKLALLFIDLDHFKNINDSLGHSIGDQLLLAAADRMRILVASDGYVARQGGDEFIILLPAEQETQLITRITRIKETWLLVIILININFSSHLQLV